ncbi:exopolysaccharide biosynthesis protein [Yoonia sp.]|uniref:exopolysaccharide biosynthesis protein n=1 Tax=Yoonia sp. TaxID=2212373 RepID=UPI00391A29F3
MEEHPVRDVVDTIEESSHEEKVAFGTLIHGFEDTAFPPCLLVPSLLLVSPLSGIPFFSSFCALVICLIAAQGAWGRDRIWLPDFMARRELPGDKLDKAAHVLGYVARGTEYVTRPRLEFLTAPPMDRVIYGAMILLAGCVPLLELMPFASSLIGLIVAVLAVALITRDGLVVLVALVLVVVLAIVVTNLAGFVGGLF